MPRQPRLIRIEGDVAYVPLTKGYEAVIDAADAPLVGVCNWQVVLSGRPVGDRETAYASRHFGDRKCTMHRFLLLAEPGVEVDHIDGNGLNNRRSNLRLSTRAQNQWNQRTRADNKSGVKGVYLSRSGKWCAQIKANGKNKGLGKFKCRTAAAIAYALASAQLHGEFGRLA